MKIVIEIPDGYVGVVMANQRTNGTAMDKLLRQAVIDGIPLPRGHGELIDKREYENNIRKYYFDNNTVIRCTEIALNNAPTVIEADNTEKEANK